MFPENFILPSTCNFSEASVVPIPTFPALFKTKTWVISSKHSIIFLTPF